MTIKFNLLVQLIVMFLVACGGNSDPNTTKEEAKNDHKIGANQSTPTPETNSDKPTPDGSKQPGDGHSSTPQPGPKANPASTAPATSESSDHSQQSGICLADNCTTKSYPTIDLNFTPITYFDPAGAICTLGTDTVIAKSLSHNRLTVIYRANYASLGRWQIYAQPITFNASGIPKLLGEKINLLPSCDGNVLGVTSFSVTGYTTGPLSRSVKPIILSEVEDVAALSLQINCVNALQSKTLTFDLEKLIPTSLATTPTPESLGALGYWSEKDVYIKADGSSVKSDGTIGNLWIPKLSGKSTAGLPKVIPDLVNISQDLLVNGSSLILSKIILRLEVIHPIPSELSAALITPAGIAISVSLNSQDVIAGRVQDIKINVPPTPASGTWTLKLYDCCSRDTGILRRFEITEDLNITNFWGNDQGGIYIGLDNNTVSYIASDLSRSDKIWPVIATGGFFDANYGFYLTGLESTTAQKISRWNQKSMVSQSENLDFQTIFPSDLLRGLYGGYADCTYSTGLNYFDGIVRSLSCDPVSSININAWKAKLKPISKGQKTLLWRATYGSVRNYNYSDYYRSCREIATSFTCEAFTLDLSNGTVSATVVDRNALDFKNIDRGFFGASWVTERNDTNKGILYISTPYFN